MNKINIDHFIEILKKCKEEGCEEVIFITEQGKGEPKQETILTIMQNDGSVIFSTKRIRV